MGWFSPKCPVDTGEKAWTEWRMLWLAERFGIDRLLRAEVLLPTEQFFPDPFHGTPDDVQRLTDRLCRYLAVPGGAIPVEVLADEQLPGAAGHYDRSQQTVIRVAESQLADAARLVATLIHELAHELLLGGGLLSPDVPDHEWVTDLLPVFLGAGVFAANATLHEEYGSSGQLSWWTIGKQGYLPARVFGYGFALFAFARGEQDPPWAAHLRLDAAAALRDGLRYLHKTGETAFHPDTLRAARPSTAPAALVDRIRTGSPSARLIALWEAEGRPAAPEVVDAVVGCLADRDPHVSGGAARTLAAFGPAAAVAHPQLLKALSGRAPETRAGAARALGALRERADETVPPLAELLRDESGNVVAEAAGALSAFGPRAEAAGPALVTALTAALIAADHDLADTLAAALVAVASDPRRLVRERIGDDDPELRRLALGALKRQAFARSREG